MTILLCIFDTGFAQNVGFDINTVAQKHAPIFALDSGTLCAPTRWNGNNDDECRSASDFSDNSVRDNQPVYVVHKACPAQPNEYRIAYYLFSGNQKKCWGFGGHEHDWERVILVVNKNSGAPKGAFYEAHGDAEWYGWNAIEKDRRDNRVPVSYIGKYWKGMYENKGGSNGSCVFNIGADFRGKDKNHWFRGTLEFLNDRPSLWQDMATGTNTPVKKERNGDSICRH